jgi:signal transduction histidine kinase
MPELAVTVRASRTPGTPVVAGRSVASALSRCLRLFLLRAQAEERERIARDLHDGAQQRLVHTVLALKLAQKVLDPGEARALVDEALEEAQAANAELRELARGVRPPVLSGGLEAGVRALAERTPVPVDVDVYVGRLPAPVETAAYFVVAEALTNVAKHAQARAARVTARRTGGVLHVEVSDDGVGGADPNGTGLKGLRDRVAAFGGELEIAPARASGTRIAVAIPLPR